MCKSNAPTSLIEQGIVVRCHSGSFISNGLEKKTTNPARSRNSSVALKASVCEKEYLVRVAVPRDGRKKDLKRKTCTRPSSLEEESFSRSCFVDSLGSHCLLLGDSTETCRFGSLDQNRQPLIRIRSISWSNNLEININKLTQPNVHLQCTNKYD